MIKVYNKSTDYLRIDGKKLAPLRSDFFESRTSQIRVLERNGTVSVTEILKDNVIPKTNLTSDPEVKTEVAKVISVESDANKQIKVPEVEKETTKTITKTTKKKAAKKKGGAD